jgi:transcriptional regulator with PAS, ATPase and Fis domain
MAEGEFIQADDIRFEEASITQDLLSKERSLKEYDAMIIEYFMSKYESDIPKVAEVLEIGKSTIYRMIKNKEIKNPKEK